MAKQKASQKSKVVEKKSSKLKRIEGVVDSVKMNKTVVIKVTRKYAHPIYKKILTKVKRYKAHCEKEVKVGDFVTIEQTRPISKEKSFRVVEINKKDK